MLKSQIKPGTEYAFREQRAPGTPFQRVRIIQHTRGTKWRAEWIDPSPGLVDYVDSGQLIVPWKEHKAFLKEESSAESLRQHNQRIGYDENSPIARALYQVFESIGDDVSFYRGTLSGSPEAVDRVKTRAAMDPTKRSPLAYTDRQGNAKPRDRSEEEIRGYRRALSLIHNDAQKLEVTPDFLRRLHQTTHEGAADAGQWKQKENEIIEFRENAPPTIRFRPVSVADTPAAVEELCLSYRATLNQQEVQPLVSVAALVFDFLCIHPFRDGNGRISRLLTLLGLYQHGYEVGRFISLERLVALRFVASIARSRRFVASSAAKMRARESWLD